jgi:NitT/TauT family transport system permease protein
MADRRRSRRLVNRRPGRSTALLLAALPFVVVAAAYLIGSDVRLAENPADKLMPAPDTLADAVSRLAFEVDRRSGKIVLWSDTGASLVRLLAGVLIAAALGLAIGIATGLIPLLRSAFAPFITVFSVIPPLAVLPILFIVVGLGEAAKIVLIVIGIAPFIARDIALRVEAIPEEQLIKVQTLGASTWTIITRVVLPQMLPHLANAVRLSLGPAWLFLIASEAIAATDGLGYRIFLVRRYLAMDVILPYVAWITLLAFLFDVVLRYGSARLFPWTAR